MVSPANCCCHLTEVTERSFKTVHRSLFLFSNLVLWFCISGLREPSWAAKLRHAESTKKSLSKKIDDHDIIVDSPGIALAPIPNSFVGCLCSEPLDYILVLFLRLLREATSDTRSYHKPTEEFQAQGQGQQPQPRLNVKPAEAPMFL